ncbi:3-oxoacyl-[acyl-carrier protein] reductase [Nocardiopsis sp. Huas11]|uniref:SDR family NAD(P)-dependent oxidoreductase n=1 Tax=Nocardiopsis sp. Huas11 TaxID=2183912 RepID=UPI000EAF4772|nr:3-oxoacyl-ACP reductase family protein [Nocardiopsis sp. Huas11]RKS07095.1 3-oxoacyl-[acyl-carrier protein] reductase [Nocardiopsis sp. Huas11]
MNELESKTALVTGGSRGIGAAVALRLAEAGADVALTYISGEEAATEVVEKIRATGRRAVALGSDSGDAAEAADVVERAVAELGRLDILVNNAASFPFLPSDDVTPEHLDRVLAVNVRGPFLTTQAALRHMGEGASVITIGSNVIEHVPFPGLTLYATSKAALVGMTRGLARELGTRGITITLLSPGPIDTDANPADGPNADGIRSLVPLGRFGRAEEIADTVLHLAGPGGRFVTGTEIHVDGGINA